MSDDTELPPGVGGDTIRDIDKGGVKTQVFVLDLGGAGAESLATGSIPVSGTFFQATQPVSAAALPLPTGAATEATVVTLATQATLAALSAKTPALGTATIANSSPVTVASDQVLNVTAPDSLVTGQGSQVLLNNNILLAVAGAGSLDVTGYRSVYIQLVMSAGTVGTGQLTFEASNDNTNFQAVPLYDVNSLTANPLSNFSFAASTNRYFRGPLGFRYFRARINIGLSGTNTGVQAFTNLSTESFYSSQQTVTQATGANLVVSGSVTAGVTGGTVLPVTPTTTLLNSAATTNAAFAKASAGTVWSLVASNMTASAKFVKLFNQTTAPTPGTTLATYVLAIPANSQAQMDGGPNGIRFATGIAYCITGLQPDTDATAVALGDVKMALTWT